MRLITTISAVVAGMVLQAQTFTLKSNDIGGQATQKEFFNGFGCTGQNISPQLSWENAPAGTKFFAVTLYDKDAPTGSGFWHWVIYNLPVDTRELKTGAGNPDKNLVPKDAVQSVTDFGKPGYGGPCPPPGVAHQYLFTVYALKEKIELDKNASPALVGFYLNGNMLAKASIVMYAQR